MGDWVSHPVDKFESFVLSLDFPWSQCWEIIHVLYVAAANMEILQSKSSVCMMCPSFPAIKLIYCQYGDLHQERETYN